MPIRRRIHAGQVYLGKEVLDASGIKNGDEVEIEVKEGEVIIRPTKVTVDKDTSDLIKLLSESREVGSREDYFEEYDYDDVGGK